MEQKKNRFSDYLSKKYLDTTPYPPSETEPDASLTIEEIMMNVARTGTTGLPSGPTAEYDDEEDDDFGDITLNHPDKVEAQDYLLYHQNKSRKIVKSLETLSKRKPTITAGSAKKDKMSDGSEADKSD